MATLQRLLRYLYTTGYEDEDEPLNKSEAADHPAAAEHTSSSVDDQEYSSFVLPSSPSRKEAEEVPDSNNAPENVNATTIMNNVLVYALADKYDIPLLKDLAQGKSIP